MSYRNKTYVAFASENILQYRLMEAWRDNEHIDFDFYDAHDLFISRDTSKPETIKANLRERLKNAKQIILLGSKEAKRKGSDGSSFLAHEIKVILELKLPVVIANLGGSRDIVYDFIPNPLLNANYYTISVSFQPKIIKYALDEYVEVFKSQKNRSGAHYYLPETYKNLGM
ncbi:TIR domain-containing protein [Pseudomonas aeruginosa]|uniref:TIR domain-containing protein n=2 Tax=Pseudomonas aeruginosa TaxID=287 RepID=UPI0009A4440B|nr:TIR domain-containing protein [Pseudomonas aeruginosa]HBN8632387.1 TIR domain-containing protein [Pseudomonas aeruginosa]HCF3861275.1 TIR domain-containing protein [Pseudomonas aeruginosa]HCF4110399.1 TIR domain-containing protein [Pseudomonas aeruginosa]HEJ1214048.1 TIR domain-containing protein [Pseudomonas aeruginosa]HEK3416237.1 TIR domain-containing protein [Pseudomonas aeruginosa]